MKKRISPTTVIACLALFFSLTGAGMAATGYRVTSIWQIAPKVRHELRSPAWGAGAYVVQSAAASLASDDPVAGETASCHRGDQAVTGGFDGYNESVVENEFYRSPGMFGTDNWVVNADLSPGDSSGMVQAWVECIPSQPQPEQEGESK